MDQAKLPRRMADGISPLLLLFCLVLTLETGKCNLLISECLAEEDRSFQIKCTDRLNENDSFVIWTTRDGTTSESIPVSRCPFEQHNCLNWRPESFTALTLRNKTHFETQLAISMVTPSQRQTDFKCTKFSKTSQITGETQSCTLKTYLLPVSPTCKEEQRGEELYIECETPKVYPQLMCKLYLQSSNSSAASHDDSVLLVETINMATKNQDIYQNGAKYFKASCSYLMKQLPANTVQLSVEMYPYVEGENMAKFSEKIPLNFSANSGDKNVHTNKRRNGTSGTSMTDGKDWSDKILLYVVCATVVLLVVVLITVAVCVAVNKFGRKGSHTRHEKTLANYMYPSVTMASSPPYLSHNGGCERPSHIRSGEANHNSRGTIDLDSISIPNNMAPFQATHQRQRNVHYVNARTAPETFSTNTRSSSITNSEASNPLLDENPGHAADTITIGSQSDGSFGGLPVPTSNDSIDSLVFLLSFSIHSHSCSNCDL